MPYDLHGFHRRIQGITHAFQSDDQPEKMTARVANERIMDEFYSTLRKMLKKYAKKDIKVNLITFRNRRGSLKSSLRTLHSIPESLTDIFDQIEGFQFGRSSFFMDEKCEDSPTPFERRNSELGFDRLIRVFGMRECSEKSKLAHPNSFFKRIPDFLSRDDVKSSLEGAKPSVPLKSITKNGSCIVFGRAVADNEQLEDLAAVYSTVDLTSLSEGALSCIVDIIEDTIDAFTLVERLDRERFRREATSRILDLVPAFSDRTQAPASCITRLIKELDQVFVDHPGFGTSTGSSELKVRFVKIDIIKEPKGEGGDLATPRLSIYPPVHARQAALSATYYSARRSKSVLKYLFAKYMQDQNWLFPSKTVDPELPASEDFKNTFAYQAVVDTAAKSGESLGPKWISRSEKGEPESVEGIYASEQHDSNFWNLHNFAADPSGPSIVTTAGFLLSPAVGTDGVDSIAPPFAILAFESTVPDAFSDSDLEVLQQLSRAVAYVVDLNRWSSVHVDYQTRLRDAIVRHNFGESKDPRFQIAYELSRLDVSVLARWVSGRTSSGDERKIWESAVMGLHDLYEARGYSKKAFEPVLDAIDTILGHLANEDRDSWIVDPLNAFAKKEMLTESDSNLHSMLLDFVESVPSNSTWHARLSAIPRALLTRDLKNPSLTKFPTGFSADSIYVLDDTNETRQIIKFSTSDAIKREKENYQTFVRYHTPLAARMPADGFAFDDDGDFPDDIENRTTHGYGVLVSDLVAGGSDDVSKEEDEESSLPESLESRLYGLYQDVDAKERVLECEEFLQAVSHHFRSKAIKWENPKNRSFSNEFSAWLEKSAGYEIQAIIDDSSRLVQFSDVAREEGVDSDGNTVFQDGNRFLSEYVSDADTITEITKLFHYLNDAFKNTFEVQAKFSEIFGGPFNYDQWDCAVHSDLFKECETLEEILNTSLHASRLNSSNVFVNKTIVPKLCAVIHGDSHGRNLTWSEAFRQFQMIDFENVRFGYAFSDQVKLALSSLSRIPVSCILSNDKRLPDISRLAYDFEEGLVALVGFASVFSKYERYPTQRLGAVRRDLNERFFQRPFQLEAATELYRLTYKIESSVSKRKEYVKEFLSSGPSSGTVARLVRRIFASCFALPDQGNILSHNLSTIDAVSSKVRFNAPGSVFGPVFLRVVRAFALKEFTYALKSLDTDDLQRLRVWNEILGQIKQGNGDGVKRVLESEEIALSDRERRALENLGDEGFLSNIPEHERFPCEMAYLSVNNPSDPTPEMEISWRTGMVMKLMLTLFPRNEDGLAGRDEKLIFLVSTIFAFLASHHEAP